MTKPALYATVGVSLCTIASLGCGSDPLAGDNSASYPDSSTGTSVATGGTSTATGGAGVTPDAPNAAGAGGAGGTGGAGGVVSTVGKSCDMIVSTAFNQVDINTTSSVCPSGLCLQSVFDPDAAVLSPSTGPTCTAECSSDSDCKGELRDPSNPADQRCAGGFACAVPFVVGPLCCQHLCVCKDFLGPSGASTPIACTGPNPTASCQNTTEQTSSTGSPTIVQQTDLYIAVSTVRKLDLVFMIDNSPSMAPKVAKMNRNFPTLLTALKDPVDGTYPDLRVAIIDSDLGTGGRYDSGSCGPNDTNNHSAFGDVGDFQMRNASGCGVTDSNALWLEYTKGSPVNYQNPANGDISQVFGCLATNLGTVGCGMEHSLQSFEFALVAQNLHDANSEPSRYGVQNTFLRPSAYLGLVLLSDEDDCSAATNDGMFGDIPELRGESASLRCATRAHQCTGRNMNTDPPNYPTDAKFETDFVNCSARTDACPNPTDGDSAGTDTSVPTDCSPLKNIRHLADEIKSLKALPNDQILVAGIFGWPRMMVDSAGKPVLDASGKPQFDMANAKYKIDKTPNPNTADTAHAQVWDYWPVCYDPDHLPQGGGEAFDQAAWGWGAQGGLRMSAFIDEFGDNGLKSSICERDFSYAMQSIGNAIARKVQNLCVDAKLYNTDYANDPNPATAADLQKGADCRVAYRYQNVDITGRITYTEDPASLRRCQPGETNGHLNQNADCWQLIVDKSKCPSNGQMIQTLRTADEVAAGPLAEGTKIGMQCRTCPGDISTLATTSDTYRACNYSAF